MYLFVGHVLWQSSCPPSHDPRPGEAWCCSISVNNKQSPPSLCRYWYCTVLYCTVLYCTVLMLQYLCLTANSLHLRYVGIGIVKTLSQWPSRQRRAILLMRRLVLTPTPHLSTFWYCLLPRNMIAPLSPSIMSNISICWHFCFCKRMTQVFH